MSAGLNDQPYRILIIDDNPAIHADFRKVLGTDDTAVSKGEINDLEAELFGDAKADGGPVFEIDTALQGQDGLEKMKAALAENRPYAMVFVDMRMPPGWDGVQTLRELWKVHPTQQAAICTAYSDYTPEQISAQLGVRGRMVIIRKPFDASEVRQIAAMVCEKWEVGRQRAALEKAVEARTIELQKAALHDGLTGLPNRVLFTDRLNQALRRAKREPDYRFAVLFIDCDNFKTINDTHGHHAGDALLQQVSRRLASTLREPDTVSRLGAADAAVSTMAARIGGDEFAVILDGLRTETDAARVAERLIAATVEPYTLNGRPVRTTLSVGITTNAITYASGDEMLRDADAAMYHAKRNGRSRFIIFDQAMHDKSVAKLSIEAELRAAIEAGQIRPFYQPIISTRDRTLAGFEALARWMHPTRGVLLPEQFIPIAEETGLIVPLGLRMLEEACRQLVAWQKEHPHLARLTMSVNVSRRQLSSPLLVEQVEETIRSTGVNPACLKLEITESCVMDNVKSAVDVLSRLRGLNVQLQMDDFGTGYSSLSCLQSFPLNGLKIDKSFVSNMPLGPEKSPVLAAVAALARGLAMPIVAEGVETDEQLSALERMGCEYAQGFLFAKPMDGSDASAFVADDRSRRAA